VSALDFTIKTRRLASGRERAADLRGLRHERVSSRPLLAVEGSRRPRRRGPRIAKPQRRPITLGDERATVSARRVSEIRSRTPRRWCCTRCRRRSAGPKLKADVVGRSVTPGQTGDLDRQSSPNTQSPPQASVAADDDQRVDIRGRADEPWRAPARRSVRNSWSTATGRGCPPRACG
jgi:hypothetical protein